MASARSIVVGTHSPSSSLYSCCQATGSPHCSPNASAPPRQLASMLSVAVSPTPCGSDPLARTNLKDTDGEASRQGFRTLTSRLEYRSGMGRNVMWEKAGSRTLLSTGPVSVSSSSSSEESLTAEGEEVYFDGGVHFGDLVTNLVFGLTLVWLPLTLAAIFRNLFLRYRFTDRRITIQSGLLGGDRKDFTYDVVTDVKVVPRFIGEWGDMSLELKDGTKVDLRCVPKFRELAKYIEDKAASAKQKRSSVLSPSGRSGSSRKGFS